MAEFKIWDGSAWVTIANADAVPNALFDANTILKADSDNTPVAMVVLANRIIGNAGSGIVAINVPSSTVLLNSLTGPEGYTVDPERIIGKGVTGVLRGLNPSEILDILCQDAALCKPHIAGRYYTSHSPHGEVTTTADRHDGANGLIQGRYFFAMGDTIDTISLNCSVQDALQNMRFLIYDVGSDGLPNNLIYESGNISLTGTGIKTASSVAQHLAPGWYFIAHYSDSASTAIFETSRVVFGVGTVGLDSATALTWTITKSATFGSAPDPFGAPTSYTGNSPFHVVFSYV